MKLGVLTSSRADYGIYLPLLEKLKHDNRFNLELIAFGMHLQKAQGYTYEDILNDNHSQVYAVGTMPEEDSVSHIARGYGQMVMDFSIFWAQNSFDCVLALGDRWEMSAAVQASIPFEIPIAHIHGGETTLGAIDNIYRHQITLASSLHFTATEEFSKRVSEIIGHGKGVYTVGSISLENLETSPLPSWESVQKDFDIAFDDFILVTFHPESVGAKRNQDLANTAFRVLESLALEQNVLITKANSDAMGSLFNEAFCDLENQYPARIKVVSALGKWRYFSAMKQSKFILGNSSSGIIEAASFGKWVVNVGDRQKGRLRNENVIDVPFEYTDIVTALEELSWQQSYTGANKYCQENTTDMIVKTLLTYA